MTNKDTPALDALETMTLVATAVAFAVTVALLDLPSVYESNPVTDAILSVSTEAAAAAAFLGVVWAFTVLRALAPGNKATVVAAGVCGVSAAAFSLADAARNVFITTKFDLTHVVLANIDPVAAALVVLCVLWPVRRELTNTARRAATAPSLDRGQWRSLALTILMITSIIAVVGAAGITAPAAADENGEDDWVDDIEVFVIDDGGDWRMYDDDGDTISEGLHGESAYGNSPWATAIESDMESEVVFFAAQTDRLDPELQAVDLRSGETIWDRGSIFDQPGPKDMVLSDDGDAVFVVDEDEIVYKFDAETGELTWSWGWGERDFEDAPHSLAVDPDTGTLVIASDTELVSIEDGDDPTDEEWRVNHPSEIVGEIDTHPGEVTYLDTTFSDRIVQRDIDTRDTVGSAEMPDDSLVHSTLSASPMHTAIASYGGTDGPAELLIVDRWSLDVEETRELTDEVDDTVFSAGGEKVWVELEGEGVYAYSVNDGSERASIDHADTHAIGVPSAPGEDEYEAPDTGDDEYAGQVLEAHPDDPDLSEIEPGAEVAGADVTIFDEETGDVIDSVETAGDGFFVADLDGAGYYDVEVSVGGETRYDDTEYLDPEADEDWFGVVMEDPELLDTTPENETFDDPAESVELTADVSDDDFPQDTLTVTFHEYESGDPDEDAVIDADLVEEDGEVTVEWDREFERGETYEWYAVVEDDYEYTQTALSDIHWVAVDTHPPEFNEDTASPEGELTASEADDVTVEIDVDDEDFPDDTVDVTFHEYDTGDPDEDPVIGSDSLTEAGTASTDWGVDIEQGDEYSWYAVAEDEHGNTVTTTVFTIYREASPPTIHDDTMTPDGDMIDDAENVTLSVDVSDDDFPDDEVTVQFIRYESGDPDEDPVIGEDTITDDGEVTVEWEDPPENAEWYVYTEDSTELTDISSIAWFDSTGHLEIRDREDGELIDDRDVIVDVTYPGGTDTHTVEDGVLEYSEYGDYDSISVNLKAMDYYEAPLEIRDFSREEVVYLDRGPDWEPDPDPEEDDPEDTADPDDDDDKVVIRFDLHDESGEFPPEDTTLRVFGEDYEGNMSEIHSEEFGSLNRVDAVLDEGERYELRIEGPDESRSLGAFRATQSEPVTIDITDISYEMPDGDAYNIDAETTEIEGEHYIQVQYVDPVDRTEYLDVVVHERGNESDVLHDETVIRPENHTVLIPISEEQAHQQWVVSYDGERDEEISGTIPVGGEHEVELPGGTTLITALVLIGLTFLAALYSGPLAPFGALVLTGAAGVAILFGWLQIHLFFWFVAAAIAVGGVLRASQSSV
ncbi:carboxypeptidase-like regulatory domain-containing protein [Natrarchaeobaculum sulfurireducens]|uniref:NosD-like periplasmic protein fused to PKD repeat domain n=1 Tax=Natrarchaeobaculum sulfurireducens TaxID=2044521 RepID=A0A346PMG7_9EURY|nr:carboxypeptidase-like regulatory domain-containing protein [Natrarchaeobaculum sulfurireducens]AXR80712.1 NosD-like periplasmic protein fused to PKD repeat domain [Natrarchaeobaculum sulfurireducens]